MVRRCNINECTMSLLNLTFNKKFLNAYHDLIAFGTACLMIEEDEDDTPTLLC